MKLVLEVIMYLFTIIGGAASIYMMYIFVFPYKNISWRQAEKGARKMADLLIRDDYKPTIIVGIGRGGAVFGALVSGCMGNVPLLVIDRIFQWEENERKQKLFMNVILEKNIEKVLIVSGDLITGNTAKTYKDYLKEQGAKDIKLMSFTTMPSPTIKADYYYLKINNSKLNLPWMITSNYRRDSRIDYKSHQE